MNALIKMTAFLVAAWATAHYTSGVLFIALCIVLFNIAKGERVFPGTYYRKARREVTQLKKFNIFWWFLNDDDPVYPIPKDGSAVKNDWFHPTWPQWLRVIAWGWRNPTCNLDRYVLGMWDAQHLWGRERFKRTPPLWDGQDEMWPLPGEYANFTLPWFSFYLPFGFEFYMGWKPNGEFGWLSFRR